MIDSQKVGSSSLEAYSYNRSLRPYAPSIFEIWISKKCHFSILELCVINYETWTNFTIIIIENLSYMHLVFRFKALNDFYEEFRSQTACVNIFKSHQRHQKLKTLV